MYVFTNELCRVHSSCFFAGFPLDDGGSDIIYYQVERSDGSVEGAWQTVATVHDPHRFGGEDPPTPQSSLTHSVSHLSPGETYHFRVTSHNSIGVSTCTCTCTMYVCVYQMCIHVHVTYMHVSLIFDVNVSMFSFFCPLLV